LDVINTTTIGPNVGFGWNCSEELRLHMSFFIHITIRVVEHDIFLTTFYHIIF
jgi:hypothetical protein